MNTRLIYTVISFSLLIGACKEYPLPTPDGPDSPVFKVSANLEGEPINWTVNGEDFNTAPGNSPQYDDVVIHGGVIQSSGCAIKQCGPKLEVQFRGTGDIENNIKLGDFPYRFYSAAVDSIKNYKIHLKPEVFGDVISCQWTVDDETFTTNGTETFTFSKSESDPSVVAVKLVATFASGCVSEITNNVYLPHHGCDVKIDVSKLNDPNTLLYQAQATGGSGVDYHWSFESGPTASSDEILYRYNSIPSNGLDVATVSILSDACEASKVRQQIVEDSLVDCNVNFESEIETTVSYGVPPDLTAGIGTIEIFYIDEAGNEFRSLYAEQPDWTYFEVVDVEDYTDPIVNSDQTSKKVTVNFAVILSNPTLGTIGFTNGSMVIPVGLGF